MQKLVIGTVAVLMSCTLALSAPRTGAGGSGAPGRIEKTKIYQLPKDPKAVVISLDFSGGYGPRRTNNQPTLSILANGTILMPNTHRNPNVKDIKSEMSQAELQQLLHFIIDEHHFLKYDNIKVAAAKKKAMQPKKGPGGIISIGPMVADAATTVIYLHAEGKEIKASEYALSMYARGKFKEVKELQSLLAIQKRLQRIMNITHGGGIENINKMLKLANQELKNKYPKAKPLNINNFQYAGPYKDGKLYMFNRHKPGTKQNPRANTYTNVRIEAPAEGKPIIKVNTNLK